VIGSNPILCTTSRRKEMNKIIDFWISRALGIPITELRDRYLFWNINEVRQHLKFKRNDKQLPYWFNIH